MIDTPYKRYVDRLDSSVDKCLAAAIDKSVFVKYANFIRDTDGVCDSVDKRAKLIKKLVTSSFLSYKYDNDLGRSFVDDLCDIHAEEIVDGIIERFDSVIAKQLLEASQPIDNSARYHAVFCKVASDAESLNSDNKVISNPTMWERAADGKKVCVSILPCDVLAFIEPISLKIYHTPSEEAIARNICLDAPISDKFLDVYLELSTNPVTLYLNAVSKVKFVIENPEAVYAR